MLKFYKKSFLKKYDDEIWGNFIVSNKFSYNKKRILLNYRNSIIKKNGRIRLKYNYFKFNFLKCIKNAVYRFKISRKLLLLTNFFFRKNLESSLNSQQFLFPFSAKKSWRRLVKPTLKHFIKFYRLAPSKIYPISATKIKFRGFTLFKKKFFKFQYHVFNFSGLTMIKVNSLKTIIVWNGQFLKKLHFFSMSKKIVFLKRKGLQLNKFRYVLKRRLKLKKEKLFFYAVHVAAPKKKMKKKSLYALKYVYYKKVSLFYGFKKISVFLNAINRSFQKPKVNVFDNLLFLVARIESILSAVNFFPSVYFIKRFIKSGNVFVDNNKINYSMYNLKLSEILSINKKYYMYVYNNIKFNIKTAKTLLRHPDYLEVDYKLLAIMLVKNPTHDSINLPPSFDLYTNSSTFHR